MDVSIVIPTKNAGTLLDRVLKNVFTQKTKYSYEVICVDSGSKDETLDIINKYPCKLYQIPASEFGHGKTRNYGAQQGSGEYIVFITQDAVPASDMWLQNFIDAMKLDSKIAGGFGIHYPYEDCNLLDVGGLKQHFLNFGTDNTIFSMEDDLKRYQNDPGYMQYIVFFSDNNACIKRSIWEKYPYPDVDFAEDQIWMRQMIEKGYKKVYCPFAPVYHSHNFPLKTYYQRYYDEYKGLYNIHKYVVADSWWQLPVVWAKDVRRDLAYIRSCKISKRKKLYWLGYSIARNYCKCYGGYKGGKYTSYSEKKQKRLDKKISQQYKQRNA